MAQPTHRITQPEFQYRNAAQTDVTQTWRKFGWKPLPERQQHQADAPEPRQPRVLKGRA